MGNCTSPCVFCVFPYCLLHSAPWGNVFHFQEFKNITMTCAGIPPTPQKPLYRGYGGGGCIKSPLQGTIESLCPPGASPETLYPRGASAGPRPPRSTARKVPREAPAEHANPRNHCVPPGHRQRHCIPAGRRQDQGPPGAPPEKPPARHRQNTQTQGTHKRELRPQPRQQI